MGIARRKAGMMVQCPTCHAQVEVPQVEPEEPAAPPAARPIPEAPAPLFERSDFDVFLQNPVAEKAGARPGPPLPLSFSADAPSSASFAASSVSPRLRPPGLVLSPVQATWLTVAVILLVALAFGAGLLVGHYLIG
jgi:hypothetical protein